jgi:anion transporter
LKLRLPVLLAGLCVLIAVALVLMPTPAGVDPQMMRAGALVLAALALFATGALPEYISAIAFLTFGMLLAVAPADTVFAGFYSTVVWLIFGGLVVGVAIRDTGLGERCARLMMSMFGSSYARIIFGIMLMSILLALVMPSSLGRVIILIPIIVALSDRLGFEVGSKGRSGLVIAAAFGTQMPAFAILPSNVPNMVLAGAAEKLYGVHLAYGSYAALHVPMTGLPKAILIFILVMLMFRDTPKPVAELATPEKTPWSFGEIKLAWVLGIMLLLWMTDTWHGISPAWVAMAGGLYCLLPRVGILPPNAFNERVQFGGMFYVAGILGLGAVVASSGLGELVGRALITALDLQPGETWRNFAALTGIYTAIGMLTTMPALPAVLTPLAGELTQATGLPLLTVLMIQVLGFSTIILPYQMPPVIMSLQLGRIPYGHGVRITVTLAIASLILLTPLNYLWYQFLGYLP